MRIEIGQFEYTECWDSNIYQRPMQDRRLGMMTPKMNSTVLLKSLILLAYTGQNLQ